MHKRMVEYTKSLAPWLNEPNEKAWVDPATGLHCYITRQPDSLHLCGYVGVPTSHRTYRRNYDTLTLSVHGGITFADHMEHSPMPDLWWIGFDCAHAFDYSPGMSRSLTRPEAYRDMGYVTRECERLAAQLVDYVPPMSVREALNMVVRTAEQTDEASNVELGEALAIVRGHINDLED